MGPSAIALLLADARTPTGSYAHSCGLEAAVQHGLTPGEVPAFLRGRLATVAITEAALTAAAVLAADDLAALLWLDQEALAKAHGIAGVEPAEVFARPVVGDHLRWQVEAEDLLGQQAIFVEGAAVGRSAVPITDAPQEPARELVLEGQPLFGLIGRVAVAIAADRGHGDGAPVYVD